MINCQFEGQTKVVNLRHVVVDALVIKDGKILLAKRGEQSFLEVGKWAIPGGYLELDETGEQAIVREVWEETGYESKVIKLFTINDKPQRPFEKNRQNVAFVYLVKPLKKVADHDHEITETKWFDLDNLPPAEQMAFDHLDTIVKYKQSL